MGKKLNSDFMTCIMAIVSILAFISVTVGATYAVYAASTAGTESDELVLKSAHVFSMFENRNSIEEDSILPGYEGILNFSIYNTSLEEDLYGNYTLAWDSVSNDINSEYFVYTLEGTSINTKSGESVSEDEKNKVINISTPRRIPSISSTIDTGTINTGVTHNYTLKIMFLENGKNQNDLQGKHFEAKIVAKGDPKIE